MASGAHFLKMVRFTKNDTSKFRWVGGFIVAIALGLSSSRFIELFQSAESTGEVSFMIWASFVAVYIISIPILDLSGNQEQARV